MAEWLKAAVLKTVVPKGTVGSNPTSSATTSINTRKGVFFIAAAIESWGQKRKRAPLDLQDIKSYPLRECK